MMVSFDAAALHVTHMVWLEIKIFEFHLVL